MYCGNIGRCIADEAEERPRSPQSEYESRKWLPLFSFYAANSSTEHFQRILCVKTLRYLVYYLWQRIRSLRTSGVATRTRDTHTHTHTRVHTYSLFALSLPTEVIILFIDDVLSCDFDIFQIFVGVGMRAQLVGKHVVANYSLLLIVVFWPP